MRIIFAGERLAETGDAAAAIKMTTPAIKTTRLICRHVVQPWLRLKVYIALLPFWISVRRRRRSAALRTALEAPAVCRISTSSQLATPYGQQSNKLGPQREVRGVRCKTKATRHVIVNSRKNTPTFSKTKKLKPWIDFELWFTCYKRHAAISLSSGSLIREPKSRFSCETRSSDVLKWL